MAKGDPMPNPQPVPVPNNKVRVAVSPANLKATIRLDDVNGTLVSGDVFIEFTIPDTELYHGSTLSLSQLGYKPKTQRIPLNPGETTTVTLEPEVTIPPVGETVPGVTNGVITDWEKYFRYLVRDYPTASAAALEAAESGLIKYGAAVQRNSAGQIRGRIYLPSEKEPKPFGAPVDVVSAFGQPWIWTPR